jgi:hypothetical protein
MKSEDAKKVIHNLTDAFPPEGRKRFRELLRRPEFLDLCYRTYNEACKADPSIERTLESPEDSKQFIEKVKRQGLEAACAGEEKPDEKFMKRVPGFTRQALTQVAKSLPSPLGGRPPIPPDEREQTTLRNAIERIADWERFQLKGCSKKEAARRVGYSLRTLQRAAKLMGSRQSSLPATL